MLRRINSTFPRGTGARISPSFSSFFHNGFIPPKSISSFSFDSIQQIHKHNAISFQNYQIISSFSSSSPSLSSSNNPLDQLRQHLKAIPLLPQMGYSHNPANQKLDKMKRIDDLFNLLLNIIIGNYNDVSKFQNTDISDIFTALKRLRCDWNVDLTDERKMHLTNIVQHHILSASSSTRLINEFTASIDRIVDLHGSYLPNSNSDSNENNSSVKFINMLKKVDWQKQSLENVYNVCKSLITFQVPYIDIPTELKQCIKQYLVEPASSSSASSKALLKKFTTKLKTKEEIISEKKKELKFTWSKLLPPKDVRKWESINSQNRKDIINCILRYLPYMNQNEIIWTSRKMYSLGVIFDDYLYLLLAEKSFKKYQLLDIFIDAYLGYKNDEGTNHLGPKEKEKFMCLQSIISIGKPIKFDQLSKSSQDYIFKMFCDIMDAPMAENMPIGRTLRMINNIGIEWLMLNEDIRNAIFKKILEICHKVDCNKNESVSNNNSNHSHELSKIIVGDGDGKNKRNINDNKFYSLAISSAMMSLSLLGTRWHLDIPDGSIRSTIILSLHTDALHRNISQLEASKLIFALGKMDLKYGMLPSDIERDVLSNIFTCAMSNGDNLRDIMECLVGASRMSIILNQDLWIKSQLAFGNSIKKEVNSLENQATEKNKNELSSPSSAAATSPINNDRKHLGVNIAMGLWALASISQSSQSSISNKLFKPSSSNNSNGLFELEEDFLDILAVGLIRTIPEMDTKSFSMSIYSLSKFQLNLLHTQPQLNDEIERFIHRHASKMTSLDISHVLYGLGKAGVEFSNLKDETKLALANRIVFLTQYKKMNPFDARGCFKGLALMKVKFDDVSDEFAGVIKALNALISTNNDYDDLHSMTMLDDSAPFRL